jgi:hypothetical protein
MAQCQLYHFRLMKAMKMSKDKLTGNHKGEQKESDRSHEDEQKLTDPES